jgi:hypothetical protein
MQDQHQRLGNMLSTTMGTGVSMTTAVVPAFGFTSIDIAYSSAAMSILTPCAYAFCPCDTKPAVTNSNTDMIHKPKTLLWCNSKGECKEYSLSGIHHTDNNVIDKKIFQNMSIR